MEYINELVSRYQNKGLLIDTNLLLLYFIGNYDPNRIPGFKRTMAFTVDEFWLLIGFLGVFDKLVTTPNVLTEVSNRQASYQQICALHFTVILQTV